VVGCRMFRGHVGRDGRSHRLQPPGRVRTGGGGGKAATRRPGSSTRPPELGQQSARPPLAFPAMRTGAHLGTGHRTLRAILDRLAEAGLVEWQSPSAQTAQMSLVPPTGAPTCLAVPGQWRSWWAGPHRPGSRSTGSAASSPVRPPATRGRPPPWPGTCSPAPRWRGRLGHPRDGVWRAAGPHRRHHHRGPAGGRGDLAGSASPMGALVARVRRLGPHLVVVAADAVVADATEHQRRPEARPASGLGHCVAPPLRRPRDGVSIDFRFDVSNDDDDGWMR